MSRKVHDFLLHGSVFVFLTQQYVLVSWFAAIENERNLLCRKQIIILAIIRVKDDEKGVECKHKSNMINSTLAFWNSELKFIDFLSILSMCFLKITEK